MSNCLETIYLSATYQHWALVDTDQWMYSNSLWIEEISILHLNVLKPFRLFLLDNENWVRNSSKVSQHLSKSRDDWLKSTNTTGSIVYRTTFWKPTRNRMRVENFASKSKSNCPCQLFAWNITQISASELLGRCLNPRMQLIQTETTFDPCITFKGIEMSRFFVWNKSLIKCINLYAHKLPLKRPTYNLLK